MPTLMVGPPTNSVKLTDAEFIIAMQGGFPPCSMMSSYCLLSHAYGLAIAPMQLSILCSSYVVLSSFKICAIFAVENFLDIAGFICYNFFSTSNADLATNQGV